MSDYKEIDTLLDPDGVIAIITKKDDDHVSFSLGKVFERGGEVARTVFLNKRHIPGVRRLLDRLEERLNQEKDRSVARRAAGG